jgi:hypothetical protein
LPTPPPGNTIVDLKSIIQGLKNFPVDDLRLLYNGVELEDEMTLWHYGIGSRQTLTLALVNCD